MPTLVGVSRCALRSRLTKLVTGGSLLVLVVAVAGYPVLVRPQVDPVTHADAVVVLGGSNHDGRVQRGLELVRSGVADELVLSNPYRDPTTLTARTCRSHEPGVQITCFVPEPSTTQGEAEAIAELAQARGWTSVVVVTAVFHISRARWIIERCYDGRLSMTVPDSQPSPLQWIYQYAYQIGAYAKASVVGCTLRP